MHFYTYFHTISTDLAVYNLISIKFYSNFTLILCLFSYKFHHYIPIFPINYTINSSFIPIYSIDLGTKILSKSHKTTQITSISHIFSHNIHWFSRIILIFTLYFTYLFRFFECNDHTKWRFIRCPLRWALMIEVKPIDIGLTPCMLENQINVNSLTPENVTLSASRRDLMLWLLICPLGNISICMRAVVC